MPLVGVKYLSARELATMLHVSMATINRMARDSELPPADFLIAGQKKRLWIEKNITEWLEQKCKNPKKGQSA